MGGDSSAQVQHRAAFLDAGYLDFIATAIARHVARRAESRSVWRILDAGSGTGHALAKIAAALATPCVGLGLDISKSAARYASRRWPSEAFAVADVWGDWPVRDASADLVISMFAPKNFAETARVLRPRAWLAAAYPGPEHLIELRQRFPLLRQHERYTRRYIAAAAHRIGPVSTERLQRRAVLSAAAVRSAILMGPNAHHVAASIFDSGPEALMVTFDVCLLFARKAL
jgi:23S rRNA (guanine745-N1)-methyltransferase